MRSEKSLLKALLIYLKLGRSKNCMLLKPEARYDRDFGGEFYLFEKNAGRKSATGLVILNPLMKTCCFW